MATDEEDLLTAGTIAKTLGISVAKTKKILQALGIKPHAKNGVCNYCGKDALIKVKAALKQRTNRAIGL